MVFGGELTFELPDNDKQCFYEELEKDVKFDIDFQVSSSESSVCSMCVSRGCCSTNCFGGKLASKYFLVLCFQKSKNKCI